MFRGVQHINLDAKGRLSVPARQRESLLDISAGSLVVTIDTQSSCLVMYPLKEWERIERDVQDLPTLNPAVSTLIPMAACCFPVRCENMRN